MRNVKKKPQKGLRKERIAKEKAAKEAAEKARKEKERLERIERERKEQEAALNDIFAGLESEAANNNSARARFVNDQVAHYGSVYTQLIRQHLRIEDSFRGKSCRVNLRLIPTGSGAILSSLNVMEGDDRLCAATKSAVAQVRTFPLPDNEPDVVEQLKNINLTVTPE